MNHLPSGYALGIFAISLSISAIAFSSTIEFIIDGFSLGHIILGFIALGLLIILFVVGVLTIKTEYIIRHKLQKVKSVDRSES